MQNQLTDLQRISKNIKKSSEPKNKLDSKKKDFNRDVTTFVKEYKNELEQYRKIRYANTITNVHSINSIANLALLNYDINREYHNRPFPDKHKTVLESELQGKFIPPCTKFAFSKKYRKDFTTINDPDWNNEDKKAYFEDIVNSFELVLQGAFLNETKIH